MTPPDRIALRFGGASVTYGELDRRSAEIAGMLAARGFGRESLAGLALPRSTELVIWAWACWRAGGAFLPLDPAYPAERLAYMVRDAQPALVVVDGAAPPWAPDAIDRASLQPASPVDVTHDPEDLAYVIYTSGSTGRPKGVEVPARGLANLAAAQREVFAITPESRILQFASPSFDAFVAELISALYAGASLHIPTAAEVRPGPDLAAFCAREAITVATFPPSLLAILEPRDFPSLRTVVSAGEACSAEVVERWRGRRFVNAYGPTETTVCALEGVVEDAGVPPLGRPLPNVFVHLLDDALRPVADGEVGELYIGGIGLARGYRGRPDLTAAAFIEHAGQRLYRTGDLARRERDHYYFAGRLDDQVKLRGHRIELGEIAHALRALPVVADAAVTMRDSPRTELVAYLVPRGDALDTAAIGAHLRATLPPYMVPAALVILDALPLTASGKVDRKALPPPADAASNAAPQSPTEELLAHIWCEILGIERAGRDDDFFRRGGHSLLAVLMISRIREQRGVALPLRSVFEARTLAKIAREIDAHGADHADPLVPVARDAPLPLSFAQQRLWFLHQLDPQSCAYCLTSAHRLRGALDAGALERALEALLARHEALRTVFPAQDGVPYQHIVEAGRFVLPVEDVRTPAEAALRAQAVALTPFDLATGPLFAARLLRLAADDHVLVLVVHHIVFDGWSHEILLRDLAALYARNPLLPLRVQFADYAAWQRRLYTHERREYDLAFWRAALAGAPAELGMPHRGARPPVQTQRGGRVTLALAPELSAALQDVARDLGSTRFTVMLAALRLQLARETGRRDLCIGAGVANRDRRDLEDLIGFFVNTVVLRGHVDDRDRFVDLVARETQTALAAYTRDTPFELVVEAAGAERSLGRTPLVEVTCVDQGQVGGLALPGIACEAFESGLVFATFDLVIETRERAGTHEVIATYNAELFEHATIAGLLDRYERLLHAVVAGPARTLAELAPPRTVPALRVLDEPPSVPSIQALIAARAAERPAAIAAQFGDATLTYAALDQRANQLARDLVREGVTPGAIVGIAIPRSLDMLVALLGILKAGAAYAPLDADDPADRLRYLIEDAEIRLVLVAREADRIPCRTLVIDHAALEPTAPPAIETRPDSLAYVMYTSGSTGTPKGVCIEHRAVIRLVHGNDFVPIERDDVFAQFAPLGFDASTFEIWGALANGARLAIMPPGPTSTAELGRALERHGVTTLWLTAKLFEAMVDDELASLRGLRNLIAGGEALSVPHVTRAYRALPGCRLVNGYGPTENTTFTTCFTIREDPGGLATIPIGTPIRGTTVFVLDEHGAPVAPGVEGELYAGGWGVARGYLRRPDLTAERFVPDPSTPGGRLYRTGDLVRMRADGVIEFIGRRDQQVKIRGYRIELGEIEHQLARHPAVARVAVIAREDRPGDQRLVAYVVGTELDVGELRAHLARVLPAYMLPAAFVTLADLPTTPSGKLDRRALPPPPDLAEQYVAPRTAMEHALARIWCDVLGRDRVGVHDNFFACGGHSLLVMRLVARISRDLGIDLPPRDVFSAPTIAAQARLLETTGPVDEDPPALIEHVRALSAPAVAEALAEWSRVALDIRPVSAQNLTEDRRALLERLVAQHHIDANPSRPLARRDSATSPITFGQQLHWDLHVRGEYPAVNIHVAAYAIRGPLDAGALQRAVAALVERQSALRMTFAEEHGRVVQTARSGAFELPVVELPREQVRARYLAAARPHDLSREAFRAELLRVDANEHVLLLAPHHVVLDGHSWMVLESDLAALIRGASLAPPAMSFADFCFWQRTLEERPVGRAQRAFWSRVLVDYTPLELPGEIGTPGRSVLFQTYRAGHAPLAIDGDAWSAVERACGRLAVTPYMIVATAFLLLLARWARRHDACANSGNLHRDRPGSEHVIGNFVTQYPLRVAFDPDATLDTAVLALQHTVLANREQQQVAPVDATSDLLEWSRYNFNYLIEDASPARDFGDLTVERLPWTAFDPQTVHDLGLFSRQRPDGLHATLAYNAERFSPSQIERVIARLGALVRAITNSPGVRVRELPHDP